MTHRGQARPPVMGVESAESFERGPASAVSDSQARARRPWAVTSAERAMWPTGSR